MLSSFLTPERLRFYPRVIAFTAFVALLFNAICGTGWRGYGGQIVTQDYVIFQAIGALYRESPSELYNFEAKLKQEQNLITPTALHASGPNSYPPYVAAIFSRANIFSLENGLRLWIGMSFVLVGLGVSALSRACLRIREPSAESYSGMSVADLFFGVVSSAPFLLGIYSGQMHALLFALFAGCFSCLIQDRKVLAGLLAGCLCIKPQFAIGLLLYFVGRGEVAGLFGFMLSAVCLLLLPIYDYGIAMTQALFASYADSMWTSLSLVRTQGFPFYLQMTPYAFIATALPSLSLHIVLRLAQCTGVGLALLVLFLSFRSRDTEKQIALKPLLFALLFGFLGTPYAMEYDAIVLCVIFFLLLIERTTERTTEQFSAHKKQFAVLVYLGLFCLPIASAVCEVSLLAIIPMSIAIFLWRYAHA